MARGLEGTALDVPRGVDSDADRVEDVVAESDAPSTAVEVSYRTPLAVAV
jgi:hypothetical protein